jgi:hypothetical protein
MLQDDYQSMAQLDTMRRFSAEARKYMQVNENHSHASFISTSDDSRQLFGRTTEINSDQSASQRDWL